MTYQEILSTPWGVLILISNGTLLKNVQWQEKNLRKGKPQEKSGIQEQYQDSAKCPVLTETIQQMTAYINGGLTVFSLPLEPAHTAFRRRARQVMQNIPYGETITYKELSIQGGGGPKGGRAAGQACKNNPFSIIIPCHRVVKTGGGYGPYGGGVETKKALIAFEYQNR